MDLRWRRFATSGLAFRVVLRSLVRRGADSLPNRLKFTLIFPENNVLPFSLEGSTAKRRTSHLSTTRVAHAA